MYASHSVPSLNACWNTGFQRSSSSASMINLEDRWANKNDDR